MTHWPNAATVGTCPVCGGPMFDRDLAWFPQARALVAGPHAVVLANGLARFFGALWEARRRGGGVTRAALMEAIYFDDPDGGSDSPSLINTMASNLRHKLKPFGLTVTASPGGAAPLYRLAGR